VVRQARLGFSIIELLTCTSIIAIIAAISYPVFGKVRVTALEAKSKSQLKQLSIELILYQGDHDGDGVFSDSYSMGLPIFPYDKSLKSYALLRPPFAPHPISKFMGSGYFTLWTPPDKDGLDPKWKDYASTVQDRAVMFLDPFNNRRDLPLMGGSYYSRKIFSIRWHGGLVITHTTGDWDERSFWMQEN
jgi:prepilin-type N-terminal cleavage/methylation domain-containing protein